MATRADQRKFHYIYKITRNDGSGKYYIGLHSTDDVDDGYFGSGTYLWHSINKYGKEKHTMEIIEFHESRTAVKLRERELVNEELLKDPLCMNIKRGGEGGWTLEQTLNGNRSALRNHTAIQEKARKTLESLGKELFGGKSGFKGFIPNWNGRKHCDETKQKIGSSMKVAQAGTLNSQFGTCWVTKDGKSIKINKHELDDYLQLGYRRGRK